MEVSVDARTRLAALIGDPVEHSLSPLIHNTAFRAAGLNHVYLALRVDPSAVETAVHGLRALHFLGANVTAPHKQTVIPALDELTPQAAAVGAVNAIARRGDRLVGDNTDVTGFLAPLLEVADDLRGTRMLVIGAGGAARAVAYALLTAFQPEHLTLAARTPTRAEGLASDLSKFDEHGALGILPTDELIGAMKSATLVVNATPLGTHPNVESTPLPDVRGISPDHIIYDLVYNPDETRLLRDAAARGARVIGGLDMLIAQAAAAFEQWTGTKMPMDAVRRVFRERDR